ncbi:MAG: hypothetical protein DRQ42_07245 [Gammaproteobacteria bacterium]|nr:MAG: hypothetical protein DRQ42_07245 [Gammaproteobacteria bacterium]
MKRIYHPYWEWEEIHFNMWGGSSDKAIADLVTFMSDTERFSKYMGRVCNEWTKSCEHNLTNFEQNRVAWLGQAACALWFKCPESIVRSAWSFLSSEDQQLANNEAEKHIQNWEKENAETETWNRRLFSSY